MINKIRPPRQFSASHEARTDTLWKGGFRSAAMSMQDVEARVAGHKVL
ncbi:MAG: hypothetical protein HDS64_10575 [Bacteroidales bacterium]|nr:hypothetical protein [Bacteroidales bacterium]